MLGKWGVTPIGPKLPAITAFLTFSCTFQREPAETGFYYLAASISATMRLRWYTFRIPSSKARLPTAIDRFLAAS